MPLQSVVGGGSFTKGNIDVINTNFSVLSALTAGGSGNVIWLNPASSNTLTPDGSQSKPYTTLADAYNNARSGKNDVIMLVGDGTTSATARVNSSFTWSKNALHLVGVCSPVMISQRARIAPTGSTTAFTPFFTISGNGCVFQNIQWFHGFDTGTTAQINIVLNGSRNYFANCHIAGMGDAASAADAGSRSLKIGSAGSGENLFDSCTIGLDTVTRSAANATLEFTAATTRNTFRWCHFPFITSSATVLGIIGTGSGCMDRSQIFDNCVFDNAVQSTSTTMSGLATLAASAGGLLLFKQSVLVGITEYGTDATSRGQEYIDGLTGAAATSGIAVNPT